MSRAIDPRVHVESLATQTAVIFVIRTAGNPLRSRPSKPLVVTTLVKRLLFGRVALARTLQGNAPLRWSPRSHASTLA